jgi:energy-coupling factor transporter ATP-binding protein EcfA2
VPTRERPRSELVVLEGDDFLELFRREHRQGQHVAVVGPTESGKSTLLLELAKVKAAKTANDGRPARVTVLALKPRDRTVAALGWPILKRWPPSYGQEHNIVWPGRGGDPETRAARQRKVVGPLLRTIFKEGGQTVVVDEEWYVETKPPEGLGLKATMQLYWTEARAMDVTLMAGTQRPTGVVRAMWSEPKWFCIFRIEDEDDLKRVGEIGGNRRELVELVQALGGHEFLVVHRPAGGTRRLYVSRL